MVRVLLIEGDKKVSDYLKDLLLKRGFEVSVANNGSESLNLVEENRPDLLLLDSNVKDIKGESICWAVRREYPELSIIMILNKMEVERVTRLYRSGVDDFLTKPINVSKLMSRIRIQLVDQKSVKMEYKVGDLVVNIRRLTVKRGGKLIEVTPKEFKLLKFLVRNAGRVLTREVILATVWGYNTELESRAVDVYVGYLRDKIDKGYEKKLIKTVRGFGYVIKE